MDLTVIIPVVTTALVTLITTVTTAIVKIKRSTDKKIIELKLRIENLEKINQELRMQNIHLEEELKSLKGVKSVV